MLDETVLISFPQWQICRFEMPPSCHPSKIVAPSPVQHIGPAEPTDSARYNLAGLRVKADHSPVKIERIRPSSGRVETIKYHDSAHCARTIRERHDGWQYEDANAEDITNNGPLLTDLNLSIVSVIHAIQGNTKIYEWESRGNFTGYVLPNDVLVNDVFFRTWPKLSANVPVENFTTQLQRYGIDHHGGINPADSCGPLEKKVFSVYTGLRMSFVARIYGF